jgi:hypothetical protein
MTNGPFTHSKLLHKTIDATEATKLNNLLEILLEVALCCDQSQWQAFSSRTASSLALKLTHSSGQRKRSFLSAKLNLALEPIEKMGECKQQAMAALTNQHSTRAWQYPFSCNSSESPNHFVRERAADALGNLYIERRRCFQIAETICFHGVYPRR